MRFLKALLVTLGLSNNASAEGGLSEDKPKYRLPFNIVSIDDGPNEIRKALPIKAIIVDRKESPVGGEYYLAELLKKITSNGKTISHLIVGGRMFGGGISPAMKDL